MRRKRHCQQQINGSFTWVWSHLHAYTVPFKHLLCWTLDWGLGSELQPAAAGWMASEQQLLTSHLIWNNIYIAFKTDNFCILEEQFPQDSTCSILVYGNKVLYINGLLVISLAKIWIEYKSPNYVIIGEMNQWFRLDIFILKHAISMTAELTETNVVMCYVWRQLLIQSRGNLNKSSPGLFLHSVICISKNSQGTQSNKKTRACLLY